MKKRRCLKLIGITYGKYYISPMKKYTSKIDLFLLLSLIIVLGGGTVFMLYQEIWVGLVIMLLTSLFIAHLFLNTYYLIDAQVLAIRSGVLVNMKVSIHDIKEIVETRDAISSPALSLDRLYIRYHRQSDVIVSPKDKEGFIQQLLLINPSIKVVRKNKNEGNA
jgi:hypothetical protein